MKEIEISLKNGEHESKATYLLHELDHLGREDFGEFMRMVITHLEAAHTHNKVLEKFVRSRKHMQPEIG